MLTALTNFIDLTLLVMGVYGCRKEFLFGYWCNKIVLGGCLLAAMGYFAVFIALKGRRPDHWTAKKGYFLGHGLFMLFLFFALIVLRWV